jgi:hypothetical protein
MVEVDIFLTVLAAVAVIVFWVFGMFVLVYFQHPDDTGNSRLPKLIIVFILSISRIDSSNRCVLYVWCFVMCSCCPWMLGLVTVGTGDFQCIIYGMPFMLLWPLLVFVSFLSLSFGTKQRIHLNLSM